MNGNVVLIESETGSGKTEAAIGHCLRLYREGRLDGAYIALPTRTSGVQMHGRVLKCVRSAFGETNAPPVILAVPGYLRADDKDGSLLAPFTVRWDDDLGRTGFPARGWAAENSKRYLAAPFAVGTIDQALMSVIRVKHAHMRAACLSRSLIVIDEVHASDTYMTELAVELVRRHAEGGGQVLLMSATLGAEVAVRYVGGAQLDLPTASLLPYPLIRQGRPGATRAHEVKPKIRKRARPKSVHVELRPSIDDDAAVARLAAEAAVAGARVLVVRNTVAGCVGVRRLVADTLPFELQFSCQGVAAPHHGRFVAEDRRLLDDEVERTFGKDSPLGGRVLVATQTVEQSLDIDADLMITDLCPMDVLLQRLGRLWRHSKRLRPDGFRVPRCIVLVPSGDLLSLTKPRGARFGIGEGRAYDDVRIVELTRRLLIENPILKIPLMNRPLVEGTVHSEARGVLDREDEAWKKHGQSVLSAARSDISSANSALLDITAPFGDIEQFQGWLSDSKVATRLGASPVTALFPKDSRPRSPFSGQSIPLVNIPHWMAPKSLLEAPSKDAVPTLLSSTRSGFAFELGGEQYGYDADGLSKA
jgi:CRISPR-associated endonuclease/helicase Cas3